MTTVSKNSSLQAARDTKNDEFYTLWPDIEREMNAYLEYDPDVFRDRPRPGGWCMKRPPRDLFLFKQ
jgi:Adenine-specific methyltransferase EcoRI